MSWCSHCSEWCRAKDYWIGWDILNIENHSEYNPQIQWKAKHRMPSLWCNEHMPLHISRPSAKIGLTFSRQELQKLEDPENHIICSYRINAQSSFCHLGQRIHDGCCFPSKAGWLSLQWLCVPNSSRNNKFRFSLHKVWKQNSQLIKTSLHSLHT